MPAKQLLHVGCFGWSLNVPGAHGVASNAPTEQNVPTSHVMHCDSDVITGSDAFIRVPAGQGSALAAPSSQ